MIKKYLDAKADEMFTFKQRLTKAFDNLNKANIVAKQKFTCCITCGSSKISEYEKPDKVGYVFYHCQDLEEIRMNDSVYLAFGSFSGKYEDSKLVGYVAKLVLEKHGLKVIWDGELRQRIFVHMTNHL